MKLETAIQRCFDERGMKMEQRINCRTLGDLINKNYSDYEILSGSAPMEMDITHGVEIRTADNSKYGYGILVDIYPYVKWTDGCYKPCHYWGSEYYITLIKR